MPNAKAQDWLQGAARDARARLAPLGTEVSLARLQALLVLGRALRALGSPEAQEPLRAAMDLAETLRERGAGRVATLELGAALAEQGDAGAGRALVERAIDAASRGKDPQAAQDKALASAELAPILASKGDAPGAEAALAQARAVATPPSPARARVALREADVARLVGLADAARAAYGRADALAHEPGLDSLEAATVALAASDGLDRIQGTPPSPEELAALGSVELAHLVSALGAVASAPRGQGAGAALGALLRLTGAVAGELRVESPAGPRVLARQGQAERWDLEAGVGARRAALAAGPGRPLGRRESLFARALLGQVPEEKGEAASGAPGRVLAMLDRVLAAGLDLERLVRVATDLAVEATGAARGFILLREPGSRLGFQAARRQGDDLVDPLGMVSRSLVREVFLSNHPLLLADAAGDPVRSEAESVGARGLRSVLVAPIHDADEESGAAMGVLYLDDPGTIGRFGPGEQEVAIGFAARLGPPIRSVLERDRERAVEKSARSALTGPRSRPQTKRPYPELVGTGRALGDVLKLLDRAVDTNAPVLVTGESGTGKELVARALHANGPRAKGPFEAVSCAALQDTVLESELFGHVQGAFTGATSSRRGAFERAHGGTLFLDEIQEASPKMQGELLRVLETGELRPIGSPEVKKVDVRLVTASNVDLASLVAAGTFRQDLYYRVHVIEIRLPPLRERLEDIPELVQHLLRRSLGGSTRELGPGVLERLVQDAWPGNVRALKNCIDRALVLAGPGPILSEHIVLEAPPRKVSAAPKTDRTTVYAGSIELNERQLALIERLRVEGEIGNAEYSEKEGVSQPTGWRDLTDLVAKGVLTKSGRGKKTVYALAPGWEARLRGS